MLRVIELPVEIKQHLLVWQSDPYFKKMDKAIQNYVKDFIDLLQMQEDNPTLIQEKATPPEIKAAQVFIGLFQKEYLKLVGRETTETFNGVSVRVFSIQFKKILDAGATVEDYVNWLFNEFFMEASNKRLLPPASNLCMSANIVEKFLYIKKDELLSRKKNNAEAERKIAFLNIIKSAYEIMKSKELAQVIWGLARNEITINKAYKMTKDFCITNNDLETLNKVEKLLSKK